ncbi:hypothetical protein [Rhizobium sp. Rhizsp82]|uniref:hypothetical protein n=1 Tax=Rhizobium sp. Rhizsp82 TaxID=3243057 RepID=UPI0039B6CA3F
MAARAYGGYLGMNDAISAAEEKWRKAAHLASDYRQELALMAVLRAHTIMDRDRLVSFQSVYRLLAFTDALPMVHESLRDGDHSRSVSFGAKTARDNFIAAYQQIDWKEFGQIQRFRNEALAHATWEELKLRVTYGALERLVRIECELLHQLNLLYRDSAEHIERHLNDARHTSAEFWTAAINSEASGDLDW